MRPPCDRNDISGLAVFAPPYLARLRTTEKKARRTVACHHPPQPASAVCRRRRRKFRRRRTRDVAGQAYLLPDFFFAERFLDAAFFAFLAMVVCFFFGCDRASEMISHRQKKMARTVHKSKC
jgi:hypothetical protein